MQVLGIDIGGSGIKGALVDAENGELIGKRHRIATPQPSTPPEVAKVVVEIVRHFEYTGPVGVTFPAIVQHGVTLSAANVDNSWLGAPAQDIFREATGLPISVLNDADAAGVAEMTFGAGREHQKGIAILLTFGTGIGSAIFHDGKLLPNTEFGHVPMPTPMKGIDSEYYCSDKVRKDEDLKWPEWAKRVDHFLALMEMLFSPDVFIIGGGVSKKFDKFAPHLRRKAKVVAAQFLNEAGIVGAAMTARQIE
ncbi:MAG: ROK family protein [Caldilineaceae bacterium]|jgi:polyphosphate glucokinase|nr:ROK family protein [Caldilineaceae bacterium]